MKSIFLRTQIRHLVRDEHRSVQALVRQLETVTEEPVSLYDLLIAPGRRAGLDRTKWLELHELWARHLSGGRRALEMLDFGSFYSEEELKVKRGLFPFLLGMQGKEHWQTLTVTDPEPEKLIDLTRFSVYWCVLLGVKNFWIHKTATADWSTHDYLGAPAVTYGVSTAATTLFGDQVKRSMFTMKTLHTRMACDLGKSEIWVNTALEVMGKRIDG